MPKTGSSRFSRTSLIIARQNTGCSGVARSVRQENANRIMSHYIFICCRCGRNRDNRSQPRRAAQGCAFGTKSRSRQLVWRTLLAGIALLARPNAFHSQSVRCLTADVPFARSIPTLRPANAPARRPRAFEHQKDVRLSGCQCAWGRALLTDCPGQATCNQCHRWRYARGTPTQVGQRLHGAPAAWVRRHPLFDIPAATRIAGFVVSGVVPCCHVREGERPNLPRIRRIGP